MDPLNFTPHIKYKTIEKIEKRHISETVLFIVFLMFVALFISIGLSMFSLTKEQEIAMMLVVYLCVLAIFYPIYKYVHNKLNVIRETGSFCIARDALFVNGVRYGFDELHRVYYEYGKADFGYMQKHPKALYYNVTIIDHENNATVIHVLRKYTYNSLDSEIKNDFEKMIQKVRRYSHTSYRLFRKTG